MSGEIVMDVGLAHFVMSVENDGGSANQIPLDGIVEVAVGLVEESEGSSCLATCVEEHPACQTGYGDGGLENVDTTVDINRRPGRKTRRPSCCTISENLGRSTSRSRTRRVDRTGILPARCYNLSWSCRSLRGMVVSDDLASRRRRTIRTERILIFSNVESFKELVVTNPKTHIGSGI